MTEHDALLARLDERTLHIMTQLEDLNETLRTEAVTRAEFEPVKRLVYGGAALILTAVLGGAVALVVG